MHNSLETTDCTQRLRALPAETVPPYNWQEFQRRSAAAARAVATPTYTDWRPLAAAASLLLFVCAIAVWGRLGSGGRHVVADSGAIEDGLQAWDRGAATKTDVDGWARSVGPAADVDPRLGSVGSVAHADPQRPSVGSVADVDPRRPSVGSAADIDQQRRSVGSTADTDPTSGDGGVAADRSRALESWLASLPREPAIVHVGTRAAVASLEDRIAQVDDLMTSMRINGSSLDRVAALQRERLRLVGSLAQVRYAEVVASASP